ncbi:hypothetical protein CDCA_CDCA10G2904 [Cyanidium caldarium]|uniref:Methyltransferase type 11 domain-containing protein n=1 Tax=Cyanidium caldarium TaxID=2771 RepID=A0AAV9IX80_CYACA|nr:hypothetical protein CDCA_CDCA10G2904 [Cyanidium caldarium]
MGQRFSQWYDEALFDRCMDRVETAHMSELRQRLLADVGVDDRLGSALEVLEIGMGSGLNLPHYPSEMRTLHTLTLAPAPSPLAQQKADARGLVLVHHQGDGHVLPFGDDRFDCVVATLILCTVPSQEEFMAEVHRVLRPGGQYIFLDHAWEAEHQQSLPSRLLTPLHRVVARGCKLDRVWTLEPFLKAGFAADAIQVQSDAIPGFSWMVGRNFYGRAVKAKREQVVADTEHTP